MIILYIIFGIIVFALVWHYSTIRFLNPYKLVFWFGKKGSGKSTLLTKLAVKELLAGKDVYSTEDIRFVKKDKKSGEKIVLESKKIEPDRIYSYKFKAGSVVFVDEVNLIPGFDNRDFRNMDKRVIEWFRLQRHYKVTCHLFSQSFDVDRKVRSLCDDMFIVQKFARVLVVARHLVRKPVVVHPGPDSPARIDDDIVEDGLLLAPFGGMKIAFIPKWTRLFDSFKHYDHSNDIAPI